MALRFCDSFDHYATADILTKWSSQNAALITASVGRTSAALNLSNNSANTVTRVLDNQGTLIVGFAFKTSFLYASTFPLLILGDGATTQVDLRITSGGVFQITRNGTQLAIDSTSVAVNTWMHLELKVVFHSSSGSFDFRVDGATRLSGSGVNTSATGNAYADRFQFLGTTSGNQYIDDVYCCDGTGSANTNFLGDVGVKALLPDSAGNYAQWTPSAGANYQCVDETAPNGDTDYVSSLTAGHKDSYNFTAVGVGGTVKGVQVLNSIRKDDSGARVVRGLIRIGGTDYAGANVSPGLSYTYARQCYDTSPATSAAWTVSEIDGAEFGIEIVS